MESIRYPYQKNYLAPIVGVILLGMLLGPMLMLPIAIVLNPVGLVALIGEVGLLALMGTCGLALLLVSGGVWAIYASQIQKELSTGSSGRGSIIRPFSAIYCRACPQPRRWIRKCGFSPKREDFPRHDPNGAIVFLPEGQYDRSNFASMRRSQEAGGDEAYFKYLASQLYASLEAAQPGKVNVFHFTVHTGEFRGNRNAPFAVGITMGAGALARHPDLPVAFLLDWEGPANRNDIGGCDSSGMGHLQQVASCSDETFWAQREASTFIGQIRVPYQRIQSAQDHVQPDNTHAILMVNNAVNGGVPWVRLNDLPPNQTYAPANPPAMLTEEQACLLPALMLQTIAELFDLAQ